MLQRAVYKQDKHSFNNTFCLSVNQTQYMYSFLPTSSFK